MKLLQSHLPCVLLNRGTFASASRALHAHTRRPALQIALRRVAVESRDNTEDAEVVAFFHFEWRIQRGGVRDVQGRAVTRCNMRMLISTKWPCLVSNCSTTTLLVQDKGAHLHL